MAKVSFLNTDTLTQHIVKLNDLSLDIGDLVSLNTSVDSDIVGAINSLVTRLDGLDSTGVLSVLNVGTGASLAFDSSSNRLTLSNADATTSVKGVASFSSDNFGVASGAVTIKNGGVVNDEIATNTLTSNRFNSVVSLKVYDSSGSAVKTVFSPGS